MLKLPRVFVDTEIGRADTLPLSSPQAHYFRNVLRRKEGDALRIFNGRDGEWLARLTTLDKKAASVTAEQQLLPQPEQRRELHLIFAPIKKARLDILIEKATELGATHLHPVLTQNTEVRQLNETRIAQQITEAAEQCERLDIPACAPLQPLEKLLGAWDRHIPVYACIERSEAPLLRDLAVASPAALLVGPEGGFAAQEKDLLKRTSFVRTVSLGDTILRAETACIKALSII